MPTNTIISNLINTNTKKPNFNHTIKSQHYDKFYALPEHTNTIHHISYTDSGAYTSHYLVISGINGEFLHSTGLQETITNIETGEIMGQFYGYNNPDFYTFLNSLIAQGKKFEISTKYSDFIREINHGQYKQLKSGKWRKYR